MPDLFSQSVFFGVVVSLSAYFFGMMLKKKFRKSIFNPLMIAIIITISVLLLFKIDYSTYNSGAKYLSYLLTPATVCLAVPLYEQLEHLKKNHLAVFSGIISGILTSFICILLFAALFDFDHKTFVTFLPKSITTAIGMGVSEELGGYVSVTVAVIIITGVLGNILSDAVYKIFRINDPIAKGIGLGTSSHAIGTAKAMELGEIEGAMSSLSIVISGILTVFGAGLFSKLM